MKSILQLFILFIFTSTVFSQTTTTWSGDKNLTGNTTGLSVAASKWSQPHSICADGAGNIWVTDDDNHCVKLIRSNVVYTRVGCQSAPGTPGAFGYDNGYASAAKFYQPRGVVCDASNNIYVCDYGNNVIRRIDAFTTIGNAQGVTTFAGAPFNNSNFGAAGNLDGIGTNALFNGPSGICKDNSGNFYVTDENNNSIRKIVIATGAVTTLCGSASGSIGGLADGNYATAKFHTPRGITYSASDNCLYVSDNGNSRIRKINLTLQTVTVYAGGGTPAGVDGNLLGASIRAPEGIILDQFGNLLFTGGANACTIRRIEKSTGNVFTFAGTHQTPSNTDGVYTNALFSTPTGLLKTSDSTLYICDNANGLIRAIDLRPVVDFTSNFTTLVTGAIATLHDTTLSMVTAYNYVITPGAINVDYQYVNSTTAASKNPQIKFLTAGTYTIKSTVTNAYGSGTKTRNSYIIVSNASGAPVADFIVDKLFGTINTTFTFTNQTTNPTGCGYAWSFAPATMSYLSATTQNSTNPVVSFSATGYYSVTLSVTNTGFPNITPKTKTNYIHITPLGINEVKNEFLFNLFPNPNHGNFTLTSSQSLSNANAMITDVQGRTVANMSLLNQQSQNIVLPTLTTGVYFIKIISEDKVATQRFIVE
jgi:PKD repeat protein/streptogramin lyase